MKKIVFALATAAFLSSAWSCKQCGYCQYQGGAQSGQVCESNGALGATDELLQEEGQYIIAMEDCSSQGGTWVKTR